MAEKKIKKVAIKKTTYSFDINRSYDYEKQFRIIEKTPLDEIKKKAKSLFAPSEKKLHPEKEKAKPGLNPLLIGGVLALLILLGTGLFIYFQLNAISSVPEKTEFPSSFFSASLQDGGMISYGSEEQNLHAGYLDIAYSLVSVQEPTLTLSVYGETPPSQVYILSNPRDYTQTNSFGDFKRTLKDILETKQMAASDITVEQLKTVQKGSLVIVPTGRLPKQMAEDGEQNIRRILERGAHIIYIGQDFTEVIDENGIVQQTPQTSLDKIGIIFKKTSPTAQGIELFRPGYTAEGKSSDYESSIILGALSVIKNTNSNGYLVIIPQTLDGGWREDGEKAGTEISKLVFQTPWIVPENIRQYQLEESNSSITKTFYTGPFSGSEKYIRADILGIDSEGYYTGKVIFKKVYPDSNGELYIDEGPALISSSVSGEKIRIIASLNEEPPLQKYLFFSIISNGGETERKSIFNRPISTNTEFPFDEVLDLNRGEYTIRIVDDLDNVYAEGYVNSVPIDIRFNGIEDRNKFSFTFMVAGSPVTLKEVKVTADSGKLGEYEFSDVSTVVVDLSEKLGFDDISAGTHTFLFTAGDLKTEYTYFKPSTETIFTSPLFIGAIVLAVLIVGGSYYLAGKQKPSYYIDIPDFPPAEFRKVSVSADFMKDILEKENQYHKWTMTPLTLSEIKSSLRRTFYQGRHLIVSDYNLEYLLSSLIKKNEIVEYLNYYMLKRWIEKSGKSPRYLSVFRKIRDICVDNAVPFTQMGEAKLCDTVLTVMGQDIFVHIYEESGAESILQNLIKNSRKGINIVLFAENYEKERFRKVLFSSSDASSLLKMEVEGKSILLRTIPEFISFIKELKA